jgi:thiosulfate/3-mercaptopyruvate sulfurtransferase
MTKLIELAALLLLATPLARAAEVSPLVDVDWLATNLNRAEVTVLDIQDPKDYARFHIPTAVNADYSRWRTGKRDAGGASMLPPVDRLEELIGGLGIDNDRTVVIVATGRGAGDLAAAARVFWTFKVLGHGPVSVLDGGLMAWAEARKPLESGTSRPVREVYKAELNRDLLLTAELTRGLLDAGSSFVDARSEGEFVGLYTGSKEERPGTIPGSRHLPHDWVTRGGSARLRDNDALKSLFDARGIPTKGEQVHFCHSGNRAALTWFVAYAVMGNDKALLYDGSTMEWARQPDLPLEQHIRLCEGDAVC